MNPTTDLTAERAARWTLRVPTLVLTLGPTIVGLLAIASIWNDPGGLSGNLDEVTSWGEFLVGIPVGIAAACLLLGWFLPRPGAWAMAVAVFPPLVHDDLFPNGANWFYPVAWGWIAIVALDLVLVLRQRDLSSWLPTRADGDPTERWRADHHLGARLLAGILLVGAVVTCVALYLNWRNDARDLSRRAVPVAAVVVSNDTFDDSVVVKVGGKRVDLFVNDAAEHPPGSTYTVFTDPTGRMAPYGAEDADPSGWSDMGIPVGAALLLLTLNCVEIGRRRRRAEHLAADGGHGARVLVRWHPVHDGVEVFAVDDTAGEHPVAFLPKLEPLVPASSTDAGGARGAGEDLTGFVRHLAGLPDPTDARVTRHDHEDGTEDPDADDEPGLAELRQARVVGLVSDGSICVLRIQDGGEEIVLASVRPARDRWTLRTVALEGPSRVMGHPLVRPLAKLAERRSNRILETNEDHAPDRGEFRPSPLLRTAVRLLRRAALAGPPLLVLVGLIGLPWFLRGEGLGFGAIVPALVVGRFAEWWWNLAQPRVQGSRWGLRVRQGWLDHLVLPEEITEVRRLAREVVIELGENDAYEFGLDPFLDEPYDQRELDAVVATVERARLDQAAHQNTSWVAGWTRRLPSPGSVAGLVVFAVWAIGGVRG